MTPAISTSAPPPEGVITVATVALEECLRQMARVQLIGVPLIALVDASPDVVVGPAYWNSKSQSLGRKRILW